MGSYTLFAIWKLSHSTTNRDLILKAISFVLDDEGFISPQQDLKSNQAIEEIDFEIFLMNGKKSTLFELKDLT